MASRMSATSEQLEDWAEHNCGSICSISRRDDHKERAAAARAAIDRGKIATRYLHSHGATFHDQGCPCTICDDARRILGDDNDG